MLGKEVFRTRHMFVLSPAMPWCVLLTHCLVTDEVRIQLKSQHMRIPAGSHVDKWLEREEGSCFRVNRRGLEEERKEY